MTNMFILFWYILTSFVFSFDAEKVVMLNLILCIYLLYYFLSSSISDYFNSRRTTLQQLIISSIELQICSIKSTLEQIKYINSVIAYLILTTLAKFYISLTQFFSKLLLQNMFHKLYFNFYNLFICKSLNNIFISILFLKLKKEHNLLAIIENRLISSLNVGDQTKVI